MTPNEAYQICRTKNKRIKEYEPIILTDCYSCYYYALFVIKDRWPEAESVILTNLYFSYLYALYVIKGRWPETELIIRQSELYWPSYCNHFGIKQNKCNWKIGL